MSAHGQEWYSWDNGDKLQVDAELAQCLGLEGDIEAFRKLAQLMGPGGGKVRHGEIEGVDCRDGLLPRDAGSRELLGEEGIVECVVVGDGNRPIEGLREVGGND